MRFSVLISLDENFDPHLAQAENLAALFIALKDEVFEIRELAVCIIGRLCSINPAHVMPFLRKMLIEVCEPQCHYIIIIIIINLLRIMQHKLNNQKQTKHRTNVEERQYEIIKQNFKM